MDEAARRCAPYAQLQHVFIPFTVLWAIALSCWIFNTFHRNYRSANSLHSVLTWLPLVETLYTLLAVFYYRACPWTSVGGNLIAAALLMVSVLKEPLNLLCLLLASKGWRMTRESLAQGEACIAVSVVLFFYAAVVVSLFGNGAGWSAPLILAYFCMFVSIIASIRANLRVLKAQLLAMGALNINPLTTPAYAKYVMFRRLAFATGCYVTAVIAIQLALQLSRAPTWSLVLASQAVELTCATFIGISLRARPLSGASVFAQLQQFALAAAEELLPTVTSVSIGDLVLSAPGMVAWSDKMAVPPGGADADADGQISFVVVNPGGAEEAVQTAVCADAAAATAPSTVTPRYGYAMAPLSVSSETEPPLADASSALSPAAGSIRAASTRVAPRRPQAPR